MLRPSGDDGISTISEAVPRQYRVVTDRQRDIQTDRPFVSKTVCLCITSE